MVARSTADSDFVRVEAPWTPEQIASLTDYQLHGTGPKYTCPNKRHRRGISLVPTLYGWVCEGAGQNCCDYGQVWAHGFTADGTWRDMDAATLAVLDGLTASRDNQQKKE